MRRALHKSVAYRTDVVDATEYGLEQFGDSVSSAFLDNLENTELLIAEFPHIGTSLRIGTTSDDVRRFVIGPYNLIYLVQADEIVLLRLIRHERDNQSLSTP